MEIVYAVHRVPECAGRRFVNAQFFNGIDASASRVFVVSGYPTIAEAYRAASIPVVMIGQGYRATLPEPSKGLVHRIVQRARRK